MNVKQASSLTRALLPPRAPLAALVVLAASIAGPADAASYRATDHPYEHEDTRALVVLVNEAADLVATKGEAAFRDFRVDGSRWRFGETYVFVLDAEGTMLLHPDPALEGKNALELKDVGGKPIIRGLIDAVTVDADKPEGWYHYQWPVPGGLLPRWKSSYVRLVTAPTGKRYVVGSGVYNDRMERAFVVDLVNNAVAELEKDGAGALGL
ncbi:MAG TPA: cache domain-containing protein, partial [Candidatus Binatia bacterium]|nr:cache domain-containing protein [Candidatus Binatia bacterium]